MQELTEGLKRLGLGLTTTQIERLAATLDEDNSGEISVDEFVGGLEKAVRARKARAAAGVRACAADAVSSWEVKKLALEVPAFFSQTMANLNLGN